MDKLSRKLFDVQLETNPTKKTLMPENFSIQARRIDKPATVLNFNNFTTSNFKENIDELIDDYSDVNRPVVANTAMQGSLYIQITDSNDPKVVFIDDVIQLGSYRYTIKDLNENIATLDKPLKEQIEIGTEIHRYGNNGIYNFTISLGLDSRDTEAYYELTIINRNDEIFRRVKDIVRVVDYMETTDTASVI